MDPPNAEGIAPDVFSPTEGRNSIHGEGGIVNLDDEMAVGADVEHSYWRGDANEEFEPVRVEVNESPVIQINSNMLGGVEKAADSPVGSSNSQSRTPKACLSQNGYFEEIIKTTNQVGAFKGNDVIVEPSSNGVEVPSCLGRVKDCQPYEDPNAMHSTNDYQAHEGSHTKDLNEGDLEGDEVHSQLELSLIHI